MNRFKIGAASLILLSGCSSKQELDRSAIFKLKNDCAVMKEKFDRDAKAKNTLYFVESIRSVTYSPKLNTCLLAKSESFLDGHLHAEEEWLTVNDLFTHRTVWQLKQKNWISDADEQLDHKIDELQ